MPTVLRRLATAAALAAAVCAVAAGCRPEPVPDATPAPTGSATVAPSASPSAAPSATPAQTPQAGGLPASCEDVYSPSMLATLNAQIPPLNDPGVTMLSTQIVDLLEIQGSGVPTLRCSWGAPSEVGIATNVTLLTDGQSDAILTALGGAGFACAAYGDGQLCTIEERGVSLDDQQYSHGESHYVDGAHWSATAWLNISVAGYTEDIVSHLWG